MKNFITLLLLTAFCISSGQVFALTNQQKGNALKNFKALEYKMLFESDKIFLDSSTRNVFESSRKAQLYKGIREKVTDKRDFLEDESNKLVSKISNLKDSIAILDKDIANLKEETIKINNQIIEITKKLRTTRETIDFLKSQNREK